MEDVVHPLVIGLRGLYVVDDWQWIVLADHTACPLLDFDGRLPRLVYVLTREVFECRHVFANVVTVGVNFAAEVDRAVEERRLLEGIAGRMPHPNASVDARVGV